MWLQNNSLAYTTTLHCCGDVKLWREYDADFYFIGDIENYFAPTKWLQVSYEEESLNVIASPYGCNHMVAIKINIVCSSSAYLIFCSTRKRLLSFVTKYCMTEIINPTQTWEVGSIKTFFPFNLLLILNTNI